MQVHSVKLSREGRVLIPREVRQALNFSEGESLGLRVQDGEIRIFSRAQALLAMQKRMAKYKRPGVSVVDELIRERRRAAAIE